MNRNLHIDVEEFRRLWETGVPASSIARRFSLTTNHVYRLRVQCGIPDREDMRTKHKNPSPCQIAERAAALRERHLAEMRALG